MRVYSLAVFSIFGFITAILLSVSVAGDGISPSDQEDELSLVETVLLFPLSITGKTRPPQDMGDETSNLGMVSHILTASRDWLFEETLGSTSWLEQYVMQPVDVIRQSVDVVTQNTIQLYTCFVDVITQTVLDLPNCFTNLRETCGSLLTMQTLLTMQNTLCSTLDTSVSFFKDNVGRVLQWSGSSTDMLRYAVVALLVLSIIPVFTHIGSTKVTRKDTERKRPMSKRHLENTDGQLKSAGFTKFFTRALSPVLEKSESMFPKKRTKRNFTMKSFQVSPQRHYLMCEYFDLQPCNCGGRDEPLVRFEQITKANANKNKTKVQLYNNDRQRVSGKTQVNPVTCTENTKSQLEYSNVPKCRRKRCISPQTTPVDRGHAVDPDINIDNCVGDSVEVNLPHQRRATLELYETEQGGNDLDLSITSDIGEPCCNSSFKEEKLYLIQKATETHSIGDGPDAHCPTIVTRRSPIKQLGISFDNEDSSSSLDQSFEEVSDSGYEKDNDSLLDSSVLNRSMTYDSGHGFLELVVVIMMQNVYKWTKDFLRQRKLSKHGNGVKSPPHKLDTVKSYFVKHGSGDLELNISKNAMETDIDQSFYDNQSESSNFESFVSSIRDTQNNIHKTDKPYTSREHVLASETRGSAGPTDETLPFVYDNDGSRQLVVFSDEVLVDAMRDNNEKDEELKVCDMKDDEIPNNMRSKDKHGTNTTELTDNETDTNTDQIASEGSADREMLYVD